MKNGEKLKADAAKAKDGRARRDDYRVPLSLWMLALLPSGSRKTAVLNTLSAPGVRWEKLERDRARSEISRIYAQREIAAKRIEKLKMDAAKAKDDKTRRLIQDEGGHGALPA